MREATLIAYFVIGFIVAVGTTYYNAGFVNHSTFELGFFFLLALLFWPIGIVLLLICGLAGGIGTFFRWLYFEGMDKLLRRETESDEAVTT